MATYSGAGLYGKIPAQGDFIRVHATDAAARPFVLWLEEGSEATKRTGFSSSSEPVRFLFRPGGVQQALVGVLVGSADKVGRSFPLALFAQVEGSDLASTFPMVPRIAAGFLDAATALAREAASLPATELAARVERLPLPRPGDVGAAVAEARALATQNGRELLTRVFGDAANGQRLYALHCFRTACRAVRGREPTRTATVLDCPVRAEVDRWAWLELARHGLGWETPPSFFWSERPQSRLLLSLGAVPPSLFGVLWRPQASDARVWPLVTDKEAAIASAQRALGASVVAALDHDLSLGDLFAAVMP